MLLPALNASRLIAGDGSSLMGVMPTPGAPRRDGVTVVLPAGGIPLPAGLLTPKMGRATAASSSLSESEDESSSSESELELSSEGMVMAFSRARPRDSDAAEVAAGADAGVRRTTGVEEALGWDGVLGCGTGAWSAFLFLLGVPLLLLEMPSAARLLLLRWDGGGTLCCLALAMAVGVRCSLLLRAVGDGWVWPVCGRGVSSSASLECSLCRRRWDCWVVPCLW